MLNLLRVVNEPSAGAFAYGFCYSVSNVTSNILIYDYGVGTFDVSILSLSDRVLDVKTTKCFASLSGEYIDVEIQ